MRTGRILKQAGDEWLETFPNGDVQDLMLTTNIPVEHLRSFRRVEPLETQTPLLVRLSYWRELEKNGLRPLTRKRPVLFMPKR